MSQSKIAKYYIPCLLGILFRSYLLSMPQTQPLDSGSVQTQARILTGTWPIRKVVANPAGDLVFAGGDFHGGPDGLVLVTPDRVVKIAAAGDAAPGRPELFFQSFGLFRYGYTGDFSINDRDEVAFVAYLMNCGPPIEACGVSSLTQSNGLFLFSESSRQTIAIVGDPAPGTADGVFNEFLRTIIHYNGTVLFAATVRMPDGTITAGLFLFSANRIDKVHVNGDPTPVGPARLFVPGAEPQLPMFLSHEGTALFTGYLGQGPDQPVLFRYQNGTISKVIADGDPAPGGGVLGNFFEASANSRGDIVFRANGGRSGESDNLYYMGKDGNSFKIIGSGETTSAGDTLQFWAIGGTSHNRYPVSLPARSKINDSGQVLFASLFQQGNSLAQGLFLFSSGEIRKIVADGDPVPGRSDSTFSCCGSFPGGKTLELSLNNLGMAAFPAGTFRNSGMSRLLYFPGVFLYADGSLSNVLLADGAAPGTDGESFVASAWFSLGDSARIALHSTVCCGAFKEGIFQGQITSNIPNGDFEAIGAGGLPEHWQIVWTNSGTGEAFQYYGPDVFSGTNALRLHVDQGGGSLFVLSDPIPIATNAPYLITSQMRYNLASPADAVYFSVIQFDSADNPVGFDEVKGNSNDNQWTWVLKALPIRTTSNTAFIRIRFGLVSATETYLDVDAVR
jgi:hypothetical protein